MLYTELKEKVNREFLKHIKNRGNDNNGEYTPLYSFYIIYKFFEGLEKLQEETNVFYGDDLGRIQNKLSYSVFKTSSILSFGVESVYMKKHLFSQTIEDEKTFIKLIVYIHKTMLENLVYNNYTDPKERYWCRLKIQDFIIKWGMSSMNYLTKDEKTSSMVDFMYFTKIQDKKKLLDHLSKFEEFTDILKDTFTGGILYDDYLNEKEYPKETTLIIHTNDLFLNPEKIEILPKFLYELSKYLISSRKEMELL